MLHLQFWPISLRCHRTGIATSQIFKSSCTCVDKHMRTMKPGTSVTEQLRQIQYSIVCCKYESSSQLLPAPNFSHADDRWSPIRASHIHRGKHHRCAQQHGPTVLFCETSGTLSLPQNVRKSFFFKTPLFLEVDWSFKSKAEKPRN